MVLVLRYSSLFDTVYWYDQPIQLLQYQVLVQVHVPVPIGDPEQANYHTVAKVPGTLVDFHW